MPNITTNYIYTGSGPLDAKSLKNSYSELLDVATWTADNSSFVAYNGMIVAVWKDTNSDNNGIYYLFDPSYTGQRGKKPDVTNPDNWHKISDKVDLSSVEQSIQNLEDRLTALEDDHTHTYGYRKDFPESGEVNHLYIASDLKRTYVYTNGSYLPIADQFDTEDHDGDPETPDVRIIYGGSAE